MRTKLRQLNRFTTHSIFGGVVAAGIGAAGAIGSAVLQGQAAGDAADIQGRFSQMGIDEIRNALGPALRELGIATDVTDNELRQLLGQGLGELDPYARAGRRGLRQLNFALGTDRGLGRKPKALSTPRLPKYARGTQTAVGARPDAIKPQRGQFKDPERFAKSLQDWKTYRDEFRAFESNQQELQRYEARANDPSFGSLMKPYEDKYGQQILDTAGEQYTDKYGDEILRTAKDKFELADFEADPGYEFRRGEGMRGIEQSAAAGGSLQSGAALKGLNRFNQDYASNEFGKAEGRWRNVRDTTLNALTGQQGFDYGSWRDNKGSRLGALTGQQGFDYGTWQGDRDFKYGALRDQVGIGERATGERNRLRQYFGGSLADNRNRGATQAGQWRMNAANSIAEYLSGQGNSQAAGRIGEANAFGDAFQGGSNALLYALLYGNRGGGSGGGGGGGA